eukprot:COSAG06_NODE_56305_length_285_cov_1.069892_1_plen_69_part_10
MPFSCRSHPHYASWVGIGGLVADGVALSKARLLAGQSGNDIGGGGGGRENYGGGSKRKGGGGYGAVDDD